MVLLIAKLKKKKIDIVKETSIFKRSIKLILNNDF